MREILGTIWSLIFSMLFIFFAVKMPEVIGNKPVAYIVSSAMILLVIWILFKVFRYWIKRFLR